MRKQTGSITLKLLTGALLAALSIPSMAQDSLNLILNQTDYTIDLHNLQTVDISGSVFAPTDGMGNGTNVSDHTLDTLAITNTSKPTGAGSYFAVTGNEAFSTSGPLKDDPTGFFNNLLGVTFHAGSADQVTNVQIEALTLDPTMPTLIPSSQLVGDYQFNLILQDAGGTNNLGQANFTLHIVDTTPTGGGGGGSPVPEASTSVAFGLLLAAGGTSLVVKRRVNVKSALS